MAQTDQGRPDVPLGLPECQASFFLTPDPRLPYSWGTSLRKRKFFLCPFEWQIF